MVDVDFLERSQGLLLAQRARKLLVAYWIGLEDQFSAYCFAEKLCEVGADPRGVIIEIQRAGVYEVDAAALPTVSLDQPFAAAIISEG